MSCFPPGRRRRDIVLRLRRNTPIVSTAKHGLRKHGSSPTCSKLAATAAYMASDIARTPARTPAPILSGWHTPAVMGRAGRSRTERATSTHARQPASATHVQAEGTPASGRGTRHRHPRVDQRVCHRTRGYIVSAHRKAPGLPIARATQCAFRRPGTPQRRRASQPVLVARAPTPRPPAGAGARDTSREARERLQTPMTRAHLAGRHD